jgi:hypothetical protein
MTPSDIARTMDLVTGCWTTQAIHAAVKLGVIAALAAGPAGAPAIASKLGLHPRATYRLLRALAGLGLCEHRDDDAFALAGAGRALLADAPGSLHAFALHWGERMWRGFGDLDEVVRTGTPSRDWGRDRFFSLEHRPDQAQVLHGSMVGATRRDAQAIVDACDFADAREVVDVGGGYGALLAAVLKAHPGLAGATADLPYVREGALTFLAAEGLGKRARFAPLDFFVSAPPPADVYLLKSVLHDWDDAEAIAILRGVRAAMDERARLVVVERCAPARATALPAHEAVLRSDLQMMAVTGGVERTEREYDELFAAAGLERRRTLPTASPFSVLEAVARNEAGVRV